MLVKEASKAFPSYVAKETCKLVLLKYRYSKYYTISYFRN